MVQSRGKMSRAQGWSWKLPKLIKMELERNLGCVGWTYFVECEPLNQQFQFESSLLVVLIESFPNLGNQREPFDEPFQCTISNWLKCPRLVWNNFYETISDLRGCLHGTHFPSITLVCAWQVENVENFSLCATSHSLRYIYEFMMDCSSSYSNIRWKTWKCTAIITQWEHCLSMEWRTDLNVKNSKVAVGDSKAAVGSPKPQVCGYLLFFW